MEPKPEKPPETVTDILAEMKRDLEKVEDKNGLD